MFVQGPCRFHWFSQNGIFSLFLSLSLPPSLPPSLSLSLILTLPGPSKSSMQEKNIELLALPQHQHTSFLCPDVSDRITLSFFKELLIFQKFLEKGQGNPVRNVGTKKTRVLVLRESEKIYMAQQEPKETLNCCLYNPTCKLTVTQGSINKTHMRM